MISCDVISVRPSGSGLLSFRYSQWWTVHSRYHHPEATKTSTVRSGRPCSKMHPTLMSFLMVLESRCLGGALVSATAGLPGQLRESTQKKTSFSHTWEKKDVDLGWLWIQLAWFGACLDNPPCLSARLHWSPRAKILSPSAVRDSRDLLAVDRCSSWHNSWDMIRTVQDCFQACFQIFHHISTYLQCFPQYQRASVPTSAQNKSPSPLAALAKPTLAETTASPALGLHRCPTVFGTKPDNFMLNKKTYNIYICIYIYVYIYVYIYICGFPPWKTSLIDLTDPICSMAGSEKTSTRKT